MKKLKVSRKNAGARADVFVAEMMPAFSRSSLSMLFKDHLVLANGEPIKAGYKLKASDVIEIDDSLLFAKPADIDLHILYEDEDVLVLNKPAGVLTHSKGALNTEATVASFIKPKLIDYESTNNRAGIVHRLDRATSGVIITAKNQKALKWLQKQFSTRKVNKIYHAIVEGVPEPSEAIVDAPIERNPKKPQTFKVGSGGRQAITNYKVLKVLNSSSKSYALLELNPKTGRTHQLRVHLKYIGHLIVGDYVYGKAGDNLYLHASSLELSLPGGKRMKFEAPLPKIFEDFSE